MRPPPPSIKEHPREDGDQAQFSMNGVDRYIDPRPNPLVPMSWVLLGVALLVLFGWQVKFFIVEKYVQDEDYRPYLVGFCKVAGCDLPLRRDPSRFTLTHTKIDLHPMEPGTVQVTVKVFNRAAFAQPYPDLQMTLTDREGRIVSRRAFSPKDYLQKGQPNMIRPGQFGVMLFDLARPHAKAVGFEVHLLPTLPDMATVNHRR